MVLAAAGFAQETRGSIRGRVVDPSGAVVPAVTIGATNAATNVTASGQSSADGNFEIPYLLPGSYRVTATMEGFKTYQRDGIELRIGDRIEVEIKMQMGEVKDQVTVTSETPLLETATASMGQVIDQRRFADLPIAKGNPFQLMSLSPGVVYTQNAGADQPFAPTHVVGYSMDGTRANRSEITVDGSTNVAVKGTQDLMTAWTPPADVVQEFKVQTTSFDAAVGHTQGGVTAITLKSGGNQVHGAGYFSNMNKVLNANLFFANRSGKERADSTYRYGGGSLTGPVYIPKVYNGKNRTFFTYAYQNAVEAQPQGAVYGQGMFTVPTPEQKKGDFSKLLAISPQYQIYDPATRVSIPGGRTQVQPLAGNIIPSSRLNPIAQKILGYYPDPTEPGSAEGLNNLNRLNDIELTNYYTHVARVDHNISSRHRLFGRYNMFDRMTPNTTDWFRGPATGFDSHWRANAGILDDVYVFNSRTILNVRYAVNRLIMFQPPSGAGFDPSTLGFPKSYTDKLDPATWAFPYISISGTGMASTSDVWNLYTSQSNTFESNMTVLAGAHSFRFGGDHRMFRNYQFQPGTASTGAFNFAADFTHGPYSDSGVSPSSGLGQGLASMLLGLPTSGRVDRVGSFAEQSTVWALYFQDDWKVSPKLTLNLGIRWEVEGPLTERFNRSVRGYDFTTPSPIEAQARANYAKNPIAEIPLDQFHALGGLTYAGVNGQPRNLYSSDMNNFMPRIGFAYSLNSKTVLRGGYGAYFGTYGALWNDVIQSGFSQSTSLIPSLDNALTFKATLDNPFPDGILEPRGNADGLGSFLGRDVKFFEEKPQAPRQERWQFGIQRELPLRVLVEASYVGNRGGSIQVAKNYKSLPLQYLSTSPIRDDKTISYLGGSVPNPYSGLLPGTSLAGINVSRSFLLSAGNYSQFNSLTGAAYDGYSSYHSLQVRTERRFAQGWTLNGVYQWSKNLTASGRLNGQYSPLEKVVSDQDRPHRVVISGIWEVPFGRGRKIGSSWHPVVDGALGGWQLQGIYSGQSGSPIPFGNILFYGDIHNITRPVGERSVDNWFNTTDFERNSLKQLGSNFRTFPSALTDVRADGTNNWDLSAIKAFRLREGMNLQFRGEFLNALNHAMFGVPNASPTSGNFGKVTSTRGFPRRIQLGLKLLF